MEKLFTVPSEYCVDKLEILWISFGYYIMNHLDIGLSDVILNVQSAEQKLILCDDGYL